MVIAITLLVLGGLTAATAPRVLARGSWPDREPVLALWVWQCVVVAVLLCCVLAMALSGAAAWHGVRGQLFAPAPTQVVDAYALHAAGERWPAALALLLAGGGAWTAVMLTREVRAARSERRRRRAGLLARAPRLPGEEAEATEATDRLIVLEDARPDAWALPGSVPRLVITTGALRRLNRRQLDAVSAHEQGHARARHHWLLHCSGALARGFPGVPVFAGFRQQVHRLVELAADDVASRRFGRLTTALALVGLNEDRGVFGRAAARHAHVPHRVRRLLRPAERFSPPRRARLTAYATLLPAVPVLVTFAPGLSALFPTLG
ncbi:M56 family metallopeptidase [Streptomyces hainanensis]|uniref:M56 family peptidase n=1 Tax=Streptomyces hainanensis TaxID=402648 RepID=A0A4R4TBD5_9ACTN|nr:M56 family metallopeptidase [Streptomyces hainanensis]TDC71589.1 M56 family peptidase [Streptomyces hainanensis]